VEAFLTGVQVKVPWRRWSLHFCGSGESRAGGWLRILQWNPLVCGWLMVRGIFIPMDGTRMASSLSKPCLQPMNLLIKTTILCGLFCLAALPAQANHLAFSSGPLAALEFSPDRTFEFQSSTEPGWVGDDFWVTVSDLTGDAIELRGRVAGVFTIGDITVEGTRQRAPVTGSGRVTIVDADNQEWAANLSWDTIQTDGTAGALNVQGSLNLSGIQYAGTNADLLRISQNTVGTQVTTFQFVPGRSLTSLTQQGGRTSYSGAIHVPVPDGGATIVLVGVAMMAMGAVRRKLAL
jgi:hypothetical protein